MTNLLKNLAVLLALLQFPQAFAQQPCVLTLGWNETLPYQYRTVSNNISGLDIDLIKAISKQMNCQIKYIEMPWGRALKSIKFGSIQIAAAATKTEEREKWADFSLPYRKENMVLFTLKSSGHNINSIDNLKNSNFKLGLRKAIYMGPEIEKMKNSLLLQKKSNTLIILSKT